MTLLSLCLSLYLVMNVFCIIHWFTLDPIFMKKVGHCFTFSYFMSLYLKCVSFKLHKLIIHIYTTIWSSLVAQTVNNPPSMWETWVGKIPWRRAWQPMPVSLPGESLWTEETGGLQPMGGLQLMQSQTQLSDQPHTTICIYGIIGCIFSLTILVLSWNIYIECKHWGIWFKTYFIICSLSYKFCASFSLFSCLLLISDYFHFFPLSYFLLSSALSAVY